MKSGDYMKIKKYVDNNRGNSFIWFMVLCIIFLGITVLVLDYGTLHMNAKRIKSGLNLAVKSGTLAIQENEQLAGGYFKIDSTQARKNFNKILAKNLGLNETTMTPLPSGSLVMEKPTIREFVVENTTPKTYYSGSLNQSFKIENPSVLAAIDVKIKGLFTSRKITMYKLSSSQLTSI